MKGLTDLNNFWYTGVTS